MYSTVHNAKTKNDCSQHFALFLFWGIKTDKIPLPGAEMPEYVYGIYLPGGW